MGDGGLALKKAVRLNHRPGAEYDVFLSYAVADTALVHAAAARIAAAEIRISSTGRRTRSSTDRGDARYSAAPRRPHAARPAVGAGGDLPVRDVALNALEIGCFDGHASGSYVPPLDGCSRRASRVRNVFRRCHRAGGSGKPKAIPLRFEIFAF
jgi:hypothetical protein